MSAKRDELKSRLGAVFDKIEWDGKGIWVVSVSFDKLPHSQACSDKVQALIPTAMIIDHYQKGNDLIVEFMC